MMKKFIISLTLLFLTFFGFSQGVIVRAPATQTVEDMRLMAGLNLFVPIYNDSIAANASKGVDSTGAIYYDRSIAGFKERRCCPKRWDYITDSALFATLTALKDTNVNIRIALVDSVNVLKALIVAKGNGTVDSIYTGFGITGGTITGVGTLKADTSTGKLATQYYVNTHTGVIPTIGQVLAAGTNAGGLNIINVGNLSASSISSSNAVNAVDFITPNGSALADNTLQLNNGGGGQGIIKADSVGATRVFELPNAGGNIPLTVNGVGASAINGNITIPVGLSNISGLIAGGTNIALSGSGTSGSPYVINSTAPGTGTVTSITAGAALTGGTITTSGTIGADTSVLATTTALKDSLINYVKAPIPNSSLQHSAIFLVPSNGITVGSSNTLTLGNTVAIGLDSTKVPTTTALADTAAAIRASAGSGSVTSIATASGILGGTITSTGTLKADTSLLATQYYVNKQDTTISAGTYLTQTYVGAVKSINADTTSNKLATQYYVSTHSSGVTPNLLQVTTAGDSANRIGLLPQTTLTPTPLKGYILYDSLGVRIVDSLNKRLGLSQSLQTINTNINDSFQNKSGEIALLSDVAAKNNLIILNTSGTSGAATFHRGAGAIPDTLFIPNYTTGGGTTISDTLTAYVAVNGNDATGVVGFSNLPFKTINAALSATPLAGVIQIGIGTFNSPDTLHFRSNVTFQGSGMPNYNDTTTINYISGRTFRTRPTHLVGGTILNGTFAKRWNQNNIHVYDLGVDVGKDWCVASNSGLGANAIFFAQQYNLAGGMNSADGMHRLQDTLSTGIVFRKVCSLAKDDTTLFHSFLMENQYGTIIDGCKEWGGFAGFVNKCIGSIYTNNAGYGNSVASFMFKDNDYSRCIGNTFDGFYIDGDSTRGCGLLFASAVDLGSKSVLGCIAANGNIYNCQQAIYTDGTPATAVSQYCSVSNMHIHKPSVDGVYINWSNGSLNNIIVDSSTNAGINYISTQGGTSTINNCISNACGYGDSLNVSAGSGNIIYSNVTATNSTTGAGFFNFGNVTGFGMYASGNAGGNTITGAASPIAIELLGGTTAIPVSGLNSGEIYGNTNALAFSTGATIGAQIMENAHLSGVSYTQDSATKASWFFTLNSGGTDQCQIARAAAGNIASFIFPITINNSGAVGIMNSTPSASLTIGKAGTTAGTMSVAGSSSGTITFTPQAAAGTYSWLWPITVGNLGGVLQTGLGGAAMVWATTPYLITSTSVNAKNTGLTALVTVPAGKTLTISSVVVHVSASSAITNGATASIDSSSTVGYFFPSTAMNALTAAPKNFTFVANGMGGDGVAATVVNFDIIAPATGTSETLTVDLFGYFK